MAAATRKAQIQVTTPNMAAVPRLLCNLIVSQWRLDVLKKRALPLSLSLSFRVLSASPWRVTDAVPATAAAQEEESP